MSADMNPGPNQPGTPYQSGPARSGGSGLAIGALVLGIIGVILSLFIPIVGVILGIIAVVLGVVARRRALGSRGMVLAGIVLGVIAIVVAIISWILAAVILSQS